MGSIRPKQFAVIADVHGNTWALDAVLADIDARGIERIVALGDHAYGPLDAAGAAERLMTRGVAAVRGNEDRLPVEGLEPHQRAWLDSLPATLEPWGGTLAFHGTPASDHAYFLWRVEDGALRPANEVEIGKSVQAIAADRICCGGEPPDVLLCAHDHTPRVVRVDESVVVDPGSVGLPAYEDDDPVPHVMRTGSPHARYAVVGRGVKRLVVDLIEVEYDWEAAARRASANGRDDWARWLATGEA